VFYDASAHTATGTATGVAGANLSAQLTLSGTTHMPAGTYGSDAWSFAGGNNYNNANGTVSDSIGQATQSAFTLSVPASITYGSTGTATTSGGSGTGAVSFSAGASTGCSINATTGVITVISVSGTCDITASKAGSLNYAGPVSDGPKAVTLNKAAVTATAGSGSATYNGSTKSPSACAVTGPYKGNLTCVNSPASVGPEPGTTAITPVVSGTGLDNFAVALVNGSYTISQAPSTVLVTCPVSVLYTGSALTPCTATVTGVNLNLTVTPNYINNVTVGTATASYTFDGDVNHTGSTGTATFTIGLVPITVKGNTGAHTIGFWTNKNGQEIIKEQVRSGTCPSATWLRQFAPFQDLSATATCAKVAAYVNKVIDAADSSGSAMNAMLKAQMLATALDVYFSNPALGGNQIGAPAPIGGVTIDLTDSCGGSYRNASSAFGGATLLTVSQILTGAASQSNAGGSIWYGQVKVTQELAKDLFDAINNQKACVPVP
jgi:hypothetical protein